MCVNDLIIFNTTFWQRSHCILKFFFDCN